MKKHLLYLRYVLRHKWFVFVDCLKWRSPLLVWRGLIHDWHKFLPSEWTPYVMSFYGPWDYENRPPGIVASFDIAWLHHQHHGPHHWQHWILREDDGDVKAIEMPIPYVKEMLSDWSGAGRAITGNSNPIEWYMKNEGKIVLHEQTRQDVLALMYSRWSEE